jgi:hypothetical protein
MIFIGFVPSLLHAVRASINGINIEGGRRFRNEEGVKRDGKGVRIL